VKILHELERGKACWACEEISFVMTVPVSMSQGSIDLNGSPQRSRHLSFSRIGTISYMSGVVTGLGTGFAKLQLKLLSGSSSLSSEHGLYT
jgi:hypothetical protein